MKVITKKYGEVYIRWQYNLVENNRDVTKAFLERKVSGNKDTEILVESTVKRKPSEKNDKLKARNFALTQLLKDSFSREGDDFTDRITIREVFKNTCKQK